MRLVTRIYLSVVLLVFIGGLPLALTDASTLPTATRLALLAAVAGVLALALGRLADREVTRVVRRVAAALSEMATAGRRWRERPRADDPEMHQIGAALDELVAAVDASQRDRERSYAEAIGAVVAAVDARDHETSGHSFRVAGYAMALAQAMELDDPEQLRALEWGALLHDVGKIAVPDAILRKVGPLTEDEWNIMRQHPSWGYEILADVKFLQPALEVVYSHHERWDGAGYPRGLSGERIPITARIFAVVDTYDAITSDRPYRRASNHATAVAELERVAGSQHDPAVVAAFLSLSEVELRRLRERHAGFVLRRVDDDEAESQRRRFAGSSSA